jgi:hypothetical protein
VRHLDVASFRASGRTPPSRRGTAYVLAIGLALLVGAVATGTLLATRARFAGSADLDDLVRARGLARSALAAALRRLETDVQYAGGTVPAAASTSVTLADGTARFRIATAAADADPTTFTPATITVKGASGRAVRRQQITVYPLHTALSGFELPIAVGGTLGVGASGSLKIDGGIDGVAGALALHGSGSVVGTLRIAESGAADANVAMQSVLDRPVLLTPDNVTALRASATPLTIVGSSITLDRLLLSPRSNPYGELNGRGLYVLDCYGRNIVLCNCRIAGTLILINPGSSSIIAAGISMEPAIAGYPTLVVEGDMKINASASRLIESSTNLNPPGTPYPFLGGAVDDDSSDQYACAIRGAIAVTGDLTFQGDLSIEGVLVGGNCAITGTLTVSRCDAAAWSPPPEIRATRWRPDWSTLVDTASEP